MTRRLALSLGFVLLVGCGGGSGGSGDERAISGLARVVVTASDAATVCRTHYSEDFVRAVYGDVDTCARSGDRASDAATDVAVDDLRIDGDSATATVTERGGVADGATGTWSFVRDGDAWRVGEWGIDYLRSQFAAQLGPAYRDEGAEDPFRNPTVRACLSDRLQSLPDPEFRATAYEIHRRSGAGGETLSRWYAGCAGGASSLRLDFEDVLRQADIPPTVIECAVARLRRTVSDDEIRAMGRGGLDQPPASVRKRIQNATIACVGAAAPG